MNIIETLKSIFIETEFVLPALLTAAGTLFVWYKNEKAKITHREFERKEERYINFLRNLKGFYEVSYSNSLKDSFLEELRISWLYCSDEVIKNAYAFLETIHTDTRKSDEEKNKALGELVLSLRKDMLSRKKTRKTKLKAEDFLHLSAN